MKRHLPSFLAGIFTMLLLGTITVSTLAISGHMTIEVDPINVQVNGEVFQPKDVNGNDVPVFVYNGTTYAPLRALAEAYGLDVGYDKERNMATVGKTDATPVTTPATDAAAKTDYSFDYSYEEFKGLWEHTKFSLDGSIRIFNSLDNDRTFAWLNSAPEGVTDKYYTNLMNEYPEMLRGDFVGKHGEAIHTILRNSQ